MWPPMQHLSAAAASIYAARSGSTRSILSAAARHVWIPFSSEPASIWPAPSSRSISARTMAACARPSAHEPTRPHVQRRRTGDPGRRAASSSLLGGATLALDDNRRDHGWNSKTVGLGPRPEDAVSRRTYDRVERDIAQSRRERLRQRGFTRER